MAILKKTKQLFAALLCLCMVAAILPAGVPAAKAADMSYDFLNLTGMKSRDLVKNVTTANTNGQWEFYDHSPKMDNNQSTAKHTWMKEGSYQWGMNIAGLHGGNYVAYTLKNVQKGYYKATVDHLISGAGVYGEYYLLPYSDIVNISTACNAETLIGGINFCSDGRTADSTVMGEEVGNVVVPDTGDYILVLRGTDVVYNGNTAYYGSAWMRGFNFIALADGVYASIAEASIEEGASTDLSVDLAVGGAKIASSDYTYTVSFTDPSVASFASGKIKGLKAGSTGVTVSASYNGNAYSSAAMQLTVTEVDRDVVVNLKGTGLAIWDPLTTVTSSKTGGVWEYHSHVGNNPVAYGLSIDLQNVSESKNNYVAFRLLDVYAGDYDVKLDGCAQKGGTNVKFYIIPDCEAINLSTMCTGETEIGAVNFWNGDVTVTGPTVSEASNIDVSLKNVTIPEDGDYILVMRGTGLSIGGINYSGYINNFKMTWQGEPSTKAAGDAAFSPKYAFVRERMEKGLKSYDVTLVGGINASDLAAYTSVGFDISSDYYNNTLVDTAVFEKLTLADGELTAAQFGADYIFVQTFAVGFSAMDEAYNFMTVKAVAEKADGTTINGAEYVLQFAK